MNKKYVIKCPKCKSKFDCSKEIIKWKMAVVQATKTLKEILKLKN